MACDSEILAPLQVFMKTVCAVMAAVSLQPKRYNPYTLANADAAFENARRRAPATEVLDAMRSYAEGHQVNEMLHILLTRLLETQPLDPFEFLIHTLQKDEQLDALEKKAALHRFDLRREKTKKQLVLQLYKRLVALQRTQHKDKLEAQGVHLARGFLTSQLRLDETRCQMHKLFPSHYRDLIAWFTTHEEDLSSAIPIEQFTNTCMQILRTQASA